MLPTVAALTPVIRDSGGTVRRVDAPCLSSPTRWTSRPDDDVARSCLECPLSDLCLADALRVDADYVAGRDLLGITGTFGGVWFDQGHHPTPPGHEHRRRLKPHARARRAA